MMLTIVHTTTGLAGALGGTGTVIVDDSTANLLDSGIHFPSGGGNFTFYPWSQVISITAPGDFHVDFS